MGRPPIGKVAMTSTERSRRYRAGLTAKPAATKPAEHATKPEPDYRDAEIAQLKAHIIELEAALGQKSIIKNLGPGGIHVLPGRLVKLDNALVASLAKSIREHGLINPITVRPCERGGYWLIAGLHRLNAKKLKKASIECRVLDGIEADKAEQIEIDENLVRMQLSAGQEALLTGRRKKTGKSERKVTP
jgi:ParB family chromosome partitioning protein